MQLVRPRRRQILIDVNTQRDFFVADGKLCTTNHRRTLVNIRRMMAWARNRRMQVISTCEVYSNHKGEAGYCIEGTAGQRKLSYTFLNSHISFPADGSTDIPSEVLRNYRQIIFNQRCVDPFEEPRIDRLLTEVMAGEFFVIGAPAEGAVAAMVIGLLQRGKKVTVIEDAIGSNDRKNAELAIRKMFAKGAKLLETRKLAGISHLSSVGICNCKLCTSHLHKGENVSSVPLPDEQLLLGTE